MGKDTRTTRRVAGIVALTGFAGLALTGCSAETTAQWGRAGLPEALTDRAPYIGNLWNGAWITSMIIGVIVWGLIGWVAFRYRAKKGDEKGIPRQNKYNLPLEIMYTIVPFLIIGVLFLFTVRTQDAVQAKATGPVHTVNVVAQKWSWTFNYMEGNDPEVGETVHEAGTLEKFADLYVPVNEPVRFNITSADVDHSFWVPGFYEKMDAIPGHPNSFDVTPTKEGTFLGKCAELCGTYHSAMLFNVHVVSKADYEAHLKQLAAAGQTGEVKVPDYTVTGPTVAPNKEG